MRTIHAVGLWDRPYFAYRVRPHEHIVDRFLDAQPVAWPWLRPLDSAPRGNDSVPRLRITFRIRLQEPMGTRLYVGNLSFQTGDNELRAAFEQGGRKVASAQVMMDRDTGRSRGFAFVDMGSEADAQAAIQAMNGVQLDGRALRVNEAEERKAKPSGGGGFGRDRDRNGGGGGGRRERW
jgi:RNA recognition motif-containing protein